MSLNEQIQIVTPILSSFVSAGGLLFYIKYRLDKQDQCLKRIEDRLDKRIDNLEARLNHHEYRSSPI